MSRACVNSTVGGNYSAGGSLIEICVLSSKLVGERVYRWQIIAYNRSRRILEGSYE